MSTVKDAIQHERDCALALYRAAVALMRYQRNKDCWHNLENAAARFNAAQQARHNTELLKQEDGPQSL